MKYRTKRILLTAALAIWMTCFGEIQAFADVTETGSQTETLKEAPEEGSEEEPKELTWEEPEEESEEATEGEPKEATEEELTEEEPEGLTDEESEEKPTEEPEEIVEEPTEEEPIEELTEKKPEEKPTEEPEEIVEEPTEEEPEELTGEQQINAEMTAESVVREAVAAEGDSGNETSSITAEGHVLAFTSDLHGLPDVLENAMYGFPENTEYVSLIGDLVGSRGGDAPEYNAEDVYDRVHGIFSSIKTEQVSIIWADHDANVNNQDDLVKCEGGYESGQIYEGKNTDGSTAYYIYGVGFYHMKDGGSISRTAAEEFKEWVKDKDVTVPVLVLCHVPIQAKRGDNLGASYWNEALNYAATGVEGISTEDDEADIIRNILFLCGHNHTVDKTEYVFPAGTNMLVQIDTNAESETFNSEYFAAQDTAVFYSEAEDEEYADMVTGGGRPPRAKAEGVTSNIFYTSMIPGYLKTSGNASLVSITEELIRLNKYKGGQPVSLGTDGSSDAIMDSMMEIMRIKWGVPEYVWAEDLSSATASRSLTSASSYIQSETVNTLFKVTKEASCEEDGLITYFAVFGNSAFVEQTRTQIIPASGHNWGKWVVTREATATQDGEMRRTCLNDASHVETKVIPATGEKKEEEDEGKKKEVKKEDKGEERGKKTDTDEKSESKIDNSSDETAAITGAGEVNRSAPTGDEEVPGLWIALALAAVGGLAAVLVQMRKK